MHTALLVMTVQDAEVERSCVGPEKLVHESMVYANYIPIAPLVFIRRGVLTGFCIERKGR